MIKLKEILTPNLNIDTEFFIKELNKNVFNKLKRMKNIYKQQLVQLQNEL